MGGGGACSWSGEPWPGNTPSAYFTPLDFFTGVLPYPGSFIL